MVEIGEKVYNILERLTKKRAKMINTWTIFRGFFLEIKVYKITFKRSRKWGDVRCVFWRISPALPA